MLHQAAHPRHARRVVVCLTHPRLELFSLQGSQTSRSGHLATGEADMRRAHSDQIADRRIGTRGGARACEVGSLMGSTTSSGCAR